jgi:hypothetical protein
MRIVLAMLVMWWVVNVIFAMATHDGFGIGFNILYLTACVYGLFLRGPVLGLVAWIAIGVGLEGLFILGSRSHAPVMILLPVLFWSALAILAGNLFRAE